MWINGQQSYKGSVFIGEESFDDVKNLQDFVLFVIVEIVYNDYQSCLVVRKFIYEGYYFGYQIYFVF